MYAARAAEIDKQPFIPLYSSQMSLNLRTGSSVWLIEPPELSKHRKFSKNIRSEVAVVGGGVSGALIADRLVRLGMEVVVLDSRDIGMGSTMASTAILSYEPDAHLIDLIREIGEKHAVRAYRAGVEAIDRLEQTIAELDDSCDFRRRGSLYLASGRRHAGIVERECRVRQKHHFEVELLSRSELAQSYSIKAPCAILTREAAEVIPLKLTLALIPCAQRKGLKVFCHSRVTDYRRDAKESVVTTAEGFQVRARHVVFATGGACIRDCLGTCNQLFWREGASISPSGTTDSSLGPDRGVPGAGGRFRSIDESGERDRDMLRKVGSCGHGNPERHGQTRFTRISFDGSAYHQHRATDR